MDHVAVVEGPTPKELLAEVLGAGGCVAPIRVTGRVLNEATGELRAAKLKLACKDRRAALCPPCAALYQADAWILVSAGLCGGKGFDESVARHPKVFVTLTAPSFGRVHRSVPLRRCQRTVDRCRHGVSQGCSVVHEPEDPLVGTPLCARCFDYESAVLWNAQVTRLWNRSAQELLRELGVRTEKQRDEVEASVRLSYLKVAEFQRRGLVHLHAILRLDGRGGGTPPPPPCFDAAVLADAATAVARGVTWRGVGGTRLCWGRQFDVTVVSEDSPGRVASYLAKYSTKTTGDSSELARRFTSLEAVRRAKLPSHERAFVECAWRMSRRPELKHLRLDRHAHSFGYRGQLLTKSRGYSTTFGALRQVRAEFMDQGSGGDPTTSSFHYDGRGYDHARAERLARVLAEMRAEERRDRRAARLEAEASR